MSDVMKQCIILLIVLFASIAFAEPMPEHRWLYNARLERVVDGDTFDVEVDLGFSVSVRHRLRLLGVDTPEVRGEEKVEGLAAQRWVENWFRHAESRGFDWPFVIESSKTDSFGRYLARVWRRIDGQELTQAILKAKQGKEVK